ncbi:hypothetical protein, partial [Acidithiobacillus ferridurans]|uniref:hypothetical protein n=1 Tax=Acidithiobacillus ferridurans TaxID=1232575 RepID=UPI001C07DC10
MKAQEGNLCNVEFLLFGKDVIDNFEEQGQPLHREERELGAPPEHLTSALGLPAQAPCSYGKRSANPPLRVGA